MDVILTIAALIISFFITAYFVRKHSPIAETARTTDWGKVGVFFFIMLVGIFAREGYNALVSGKDFNWISIVLACIVSPIIFGGVYNQLSNLEITVPSVVVSFQNGFFWNSIFEKINA